MPASTLRKLALIPLLTSLAFAPDQSGAGGEDVGWEWVDQNAPKFEIEDLAGLKLTERAYDGKIVVIDFWATWCAPCVKELPELLAFEAKIKGRKDVAFLSLSVDDDKQDVVAFFKDRKERFPVYMATSLADRMDVTIFPTKLIVDGRATPGVDGRRAPARVRLRKEGIVEAKELEARVAELLKAPVRPSS
jgi:thiol-disulfide isomerase/thioredoxin